MVRTVSLKRLLAGLILGIAFGYIESACVVYLRALFYPGVHSLFPLKPMAENIFRVEVLREVATIVFLSSGSFAIARKLKEVPFYFLFLFGVWDISYYLFLKLLINWPANIMEYDILFLIPFPWIAPVYAPVIISCIFILGSFFYIYLDTHLSLRQLLIFLSGAFVVMFSFMDISIRILLHSGIQGFKSYMGGGFNPWIFYGGVLLLIISFLPLERMEIY